MGNKATKHKSAQDNGLNYSNPKAAAAYVQPNYVDVDISALPTYPTNSTTKQERQQDANAEPGRSFRCKWTSAPASPGQKQFVPADYTDSVVVAVRSNMLCLSSVSNAADELHARCWRRDFPISGVRSFGQVGRIFSFISAEDCPGGSCEYMLEVEGEMAQVNTFAAGGVQAQDEPMLLDTSINIFVLIDAARQRLFFNAVNTQDPSIQPSRRATTTTAAAPVVLPGRGQLQSGNVISWSATEPPVPDRRSTVATGERGQREKSGAGSNPRLPTAGPIVTTSPLEQPGVGFYKDRHASCPAPALQAQQARTATIATAARTSNTELPSAAAAAGPHTMRTASAPYVNVQGPAMLNNGGAMQWQGTGANATVAGSPSILDMAQPLMPAAALAGDGGMHSNVQDLYSQPKSKGGTLKKGAKLTEPGSNTMSISIADTITAAKTPAFLQPSGSSMSASLPSGQDYDYRAQQLGAPLSSGLTSIYSPNLLGPEHTGALPASASAAALPAVTPSGPTGTLGRKRGQPANDISKTDEFGVVHVYPYNTPLDPKERASTAAALPASAMLPGKWQPYQTPLCPPGEEQRHATQESTSTWTDDHGQVYALGGDGQAPSGSQRAKPSVYDTVDYAGTQPSTRRVSVTSPSMTAAPPNSVATLPRRRESNSAATAVAPGWDKMYSNLD